MGAKHTSGSWHPSKESDFIMIASNNEEGEFIAKIPCHWINAKANAKLIAAAPDLLDACEKALSLLEAIEVRGDSIRTLEHAIKKATQ